MLSWIKAVISVTIIHNFIFFLSHWKYYIYRKASAKSCLDCTFSRAVICLITHTEISLWSRQRGSVLHYLKQEEQSKSSGSNQVQQPRDQVSGHVHSNEADQSYVSLVSQAGTKPKGSNMQLQRSSGRDQGPDPQLKRSSWAMGLTPYQSVSGLLWQSWPWAEAANQMERGCT